jgi:hypothetical protein
LAFGNVDEAIYLGCSSMELHQSIEVRFVREDGIEFRIQFSAYVHGEGTLVLMHQKLKPYTGFHEILDVEDARANLSGCVVILVWSHIMRAVKLEAGIGITYYHPEYVALEAARQY